MKYVCFLLCLCSTFAFSQVGIGTTNPNASLDIRSSNEATPSNTDGLLIPKLEEFPTTNPTALQDGMIVFATGAGSVAKGFYYWDNLSVSWVFVNASASSSHDWYEESTTTAPTNISDEIYTLGNVAIGKNTADYTLDIESNVGSRGINNLLNGNTTGGSYLFGQYNEVIDTGDGYTVGSYNHPGGGTSSKIGTFNNPGNTSAGITLGSLNQLFNVLGNGLQYGTSQRLTNNGGGARYGNYSLIAGTQVTGGNPPEPVYGSYQLLTITSQGDQFGSYNELSGLSAGGATIYGTYNNLNASTSADQYGSYNIVNIPSSSGTNYGLYSEALFSNSYAGYFLGNVAIGTTVANTYTLPPARGAVDQVLQIDGTGNTTWVDPSATVIHDINDLVDGKSDNDGTDNGSSIFLGVDAGINDNENNNSNIGIGYESMHNNTDGVVNVAIGARSMFANTSGYGNLALGWSALANNTTGNSNTALGVSALMNNSTGVYNNAIGYESLLSNTTGNDNSAMGYLALNANTTGNLNTAIGTESLQNNTTGSHNIGIGYRALTSNTTASSNIAIGRSALSGISTGYSNIAIGISTLHANTTGIQNSAIGSLALGDNSTGSYNTVHGHNAFNDNNFGSNNVVLGYEAGLDASGDNNVFIGYQAGTPIISNNISGSVCIGYQSGGTIIGDNNLYIDNSGTINPLIYGEFDTDILGLNADVAIGHQAPLTPLHIINEGTADVQNIVATIASNTSNRPVLLFSETTTASLTDGMSLEYDGRGNGDANRMSINNIGGSPLFEFQNNGSLRVNGGSMYVNHPSGAATEGLILRNTIDTDEWRMYQQWNSNTLALMFNNVNVGNFDDVSGVYTAVSDRTLKKNIVPTESVLSKIEQLEVVDYNFKLQQDTKRYTGLIAQDVEKLFPSLVVPPNEESENYTMDYSGFGVLAIKAIQEQQEKIDSLEREIAEIKALIKKQ